MQASNGTYNHESDDPSRRGHSSHLSISDDSHHVTEAIGYMYDDNYDRRDSKRLSYVSSPLSEAISTSSIPRDSAGSPQQRPHPIRTSSIGGNTRQNGQTRRSPGEQSSPEREGGGQLSPALSRAASTKKAANSMPLNDIDYDSDPATVARELNNLAALRRMSMDVGAADPDLPVAGSNVSMPSLAPSASADEDDASRLFWVPARVHPGLAPNEFKTFLEDKADQIKRRSGDFSSTEPGKPLQKETSGGGLQRKKSMLSRQVDSSGGSGGGDNTQLDSVTEEPSSKPDRASTTSNFAEEDTPILPPAPPGHSLRRSTRTTYRKGSFKSGERVTSSRRNPRPSDSNVQHSRHTSTSSEDPPILGLTRVATDPIDGKPNHSRLASRAKPVADERSSSEDTFSRNNTVSPATASPKGAINSNTQDTPSSPAVSAQSPPASQPYIPQRNSSHDSSPPTSPPQTPLPPEPSTTRSSKRAGFVRAPSKDNSKTISDIISQPSPLPGNSTRTDTLSVIPTAVEEKKPEGKKSKDKKESEGGRKSSWHWRRNTDDKEKDKKKDEESKKHKSRILKSIDKTHDNTRLDVLQTSIEGSGTKGRESLVLERTESKVDEDDRRKDSGKKSSSGDAKKEKEPSLFSSFFGGGKRKHGNDSQKKHARNRSPEVQMRIPQPDVDYNWTRFSILEERAIYRMAHIKLANPRRALYSQVLLSNFMYSYLAKVQQMHPQSGQDQQKKSGHSDEYAQYQRYQDMQDQGQYNDSSYVDNYDYERDDRHRGYGDGYQRQYGSYDDDDDDDMW